MTVFRNCPECGLNDDHTCGDPTVAELTERAEKAEGERDTAITRIGAAIQHIESGGDREQIIDILFPADTEKDRRE